MDTPGRKNRRIDPGASAGTGDDAAGRAGGRTEGLSYGLPPSATADLAALNAWLDGPGRALAALGSREAPVEVGLTVTALLVEELAGEEARSRLRARLAAMPLRPVSADAAFAVRRTAPRQRDRAWAPDWRDDDRLYFTDAAAELLAELAPAGEPLTLSTVPGAFRMLVPNDEAVADIADQMLRAAAGLSMLEANTGMTVTLAVEPAPLGMIETAEDAVRFFEGWIFSRAGEQRFAALADLGRDEALLALRRHVGFCYDTAVAAVMGEDPEDSIGLLRRAGIPVARLQLSAALSAEPVTAEALDALARVDFSGPLHQAIGTAGERRRLIDIDDLSRAEALAEGGRLGVLRRVPLWLEPGEGLSTTADFAEAVLAIHARQPVADAVHLVGGVAGGLPWVADGEAGADAAARELAWVRARLA